MVHRARAVVLTVVWTGCVFDPSGMSFPGRDGAPPPPDARVADAATGDAATGDAGRNDAGRSDAAPPPPDASPPFCTAEPDLVGCYPFDGDGTDGSIAGMDATVTEVAWGVGVDGGAIVTDDQSLVRVAEHAGLDVTSLTLELWARPAQLPVNAARAGLIDNDGQYGLFVYAGGEVRCTCAGQVVSYLSIAVDTFTHVACTYDPIGGLILYLDGVALATAPGNGPPSTGGTGGLAIAGNSPSGDPFVGAIDDLRIWKRARSAAEVCAAAGSC